MEQKLIINKIKQELPDAKIGISGSDCNLTLEIKSNKFAGLSSLDSHRIVNQIFAEEIKSGALHAIKIRTSSFDF